MTAERLEAMRQGKLRALATRFQADVAKVRSYRLWTGREREALAKLKDLRETLGNDHELTQQARADWLFLLNAMPTTPGDSSAAWRAA